MAYHKVRPECPSFEVNRFITPRRDAGRRLHDRVFEFFFPRCEFRPAKPSVQSQAADNNKGTIP